MVIEYRRSISDQEIVRVGIDMDRDRLSDRDESHR